MTTTKLNPNQTNDYILNSSMARQAIINGNFDVWQRGTSVAGGASVYTADRWLFVTGSGQAHVISQQDGSGVVGSQYSMRVQRTAGQLASNNEIYYAMESKDSIKLRGKKLTLSFWAKCGANFSPTSSLLPVAIVTGKGTDQKVASFTTSADAIAENKTLTTSWQKFTITTTDIIASDITQIGLRFSNYTTGTAGANDWFEITQVQLCAGDVALPFMPKSFEEELRACQRYYEKSFDYATTPANVAYNTVGNVMYGGGVDGKQMVNTIFYKVKKRAIPTITTYSSNANATGVSNMCYNPIDFGNTFTTATNGIIDNSGETSFSFVAILSSTYDGATFAWTSSAEL